MGLLKAYTRSFERHPYATLMVANGILSAIGDASAQTLGAYARLSHERERTQQTADTREQIVHARTDQTSPLAAPFVYDIARTARFALFGVSMAPLAGAWNKFLEVTFPLRPNTPQHIASDIKLEKVKTEPSPIPGLKLPKGSRLERGTGQSAAHDNDKEKRSTQGDVSVAALAKRVAADQLGMAPVGLFIFLFSMGTLEGLDGAQLKEKFRQNYFPILLVNWQVWPILQLINFRFVPLKFRVPFGSLLGILWTCFLSLKTAANAKLATA
ncbi:hypothetical protein OIV83_005817 [Microbotryomycetes sp. JL201]|nr:hypothetical protein OIV83_005817 [Microbotryomycetes sp. JL201]